MTDTVNLGLPCIECSQAQKHVTHNDALRILDTLVQLAVRDRDLTAPPCAPGEGECSIVKTARDSGAWAGHGNPIAAWQDGAWQFSVPQTGWLAFVVDEGTLLVWNGSAWGDFFFHRDVDPKSVSAWRRHHGGQHQSLKRQAQQHAVHRQDRGGRRRRQPALQAQQGERGQDASPSCCRITFPAAPRSGLTGDDDFHFKVSPDGTTWYEGIRIAAATGKISFPVSGGPREMLAANRTYYVRTDGSNSNNGLANTAGGAFLTIQKAIDTVSGLDLGAYNDNSSWQRNVRRRRQCRRPLFRVWNSDSARRHHDAEQCGHFNNECGRH